MSKKIYSLINKKFLYTKNKKSMKKLLIIFFSFLLFCSFELRNSRATFSKNLNLGEELFFANCNVCHRNGKNVIIPEKNLQKEILESNGMYNLEAISYQITNGKNGMPAFGNRLKENEIKEIALYVLKKSEINFKNE
jgi:cytochrome c6